VSPGADGPAPGALPGPAAVHAFWFGPPGTAQAYRAEWFRKDPAFDAAIGERFGALVEPMLALPADAPPAWGGAPTDRLAEILVLDQFPRNLFRGQARAFAGDPRARALALALVDGGAHLALTPLERLFAYLPLEHAEDLVLQERCVELVTALAAAHEGFESVLDYAVRHRDVIRRFGRFPHRNAALGRQSTAEELAYLATPGSGF
jgi:uncharacterized protein (DUF924 family)